MERVLRDYLETVDAQAMFAPRGPRFKGPMDKIAQLQTHLPPLQDATARGHRSPSRTRNRARGLPANHASNASTASTAAVRRVRKRTTSVIIVSSVQFPGRA